MVYDALFTDFVVTGERARAANQEQSSGIGLNFDEEGINVIDDCDKEHFTHLNNEMKPSLKRQKSTDGVSTSSQVRKSKKKTAAILIKEDIHSFIEFMSSKSTATSLAVNDTSIEKCIGTKMKSSNSSDIVNPYPSYSPDDEDEEELEEIQREKDEKEWTALYQIAGAHKPCNGRYLPFFRDCMGALDGTHVKARLPQGQEIPYIARKGYPTQNILAVVDFNMCFTFAWAGWEGAAHDSRIFGEALRRPELNFPRPIGNKYYLVDVGYPHMKGYMAPYKGGDNVRYHLAQFRRGVTRQLREPRGRIEKFNYLHSSSRSIVERTFGVWKARWSILRDMPFYNIDTQRDIVLASMAIHNYIRKKCNMDDAFRAAENERYVPSVDPDVGTSLRANNNINAENVEEQSDLVWMGLRDLIANEICEA
ncbi:PREDICTED: uncharacterized protein LOC109216951 [Nicotiana attenuata]|uniref:uncharacterized protein LOC109216951 n=1 Tax=Nicotiana attenuata TaxID=49451 RepID=UPI000904B3BA|nr:PREDICTED: uncharacterized protein LOC109216951 [Nicotiana attenuata]